MARFTLIYCPRAASFMVTPLCFLLFKVALPFSSQQGSHQRTGGEKYLRGSFHKITILENTKADFNGLLLVDISSKQEHPAFRKTFDGNHLVER